MYLPTHCVADKVVSPLCARVTPEAYQNMVCHEADASDCQLGHLPGKPFSGVTAVCDFCAHSHKDINNMSGVYINSCANID